MATYNYEDLGAERFQELCQALLALSFPRITCLPVGMPDGGRDAVISNRSTDALVFQVKFRRRTPLAEATAADMFEWLQQAITPELAKVRRLIPRGLTQYIVLTNATTSSHLDIGTRDKMRDWLSEQLPIEASVWWRDDLDRRLEPQWELKRVYGLLEAPKATDSLLRAFVEGRLVTNKTLSSPAPATRFTSVQKFLSSQFDRDSVIRFKEADLPRQPLLQSYLDIGAELRVQRQEMDRIARYGRKIRTTPSNDGQYRWAEMGDRISYYGNYAAAGLLLQLAGTPNLKNTVIEGAPGQGKSTLVQYICQIHRARLLGREVALKGIPHEYRSSPILMPFRTDLRDLATWFKGENPFRSDDASIRGFPRTVEGFLAAMVADAAGGSTFTVDDFDALVAEMPTLLVFDGLDEVAEIDSRSRIVEHITEFSSRMQDIALELRIVVTSRPSAFSTSSRFPVDAFSYLSLTNLTEPLILDYTKTWAKTRGLDASGTSDLTKTLTDKLHQPHIADLSRNSMQLAILLWLLYQQADSLPDQRTSLYEQYIKTFLNREAGKSAVIRLHKGIVLQVHAYVAWVLQARAESSGSRGNMSMEEIKEISRSYLQSLGYCEDDLNVVDKLFVQMVDRVGVIVSRIQGSYEFEVQPLREYFAASHLYQVARYSPAGREVAGTKADIFDALAKNPYWQNVTRFFVGFFDKGELAHLVVQYSEMFELSDYGSLSYPRILAANTMTDRVFYQSPGMGQRLARRIVSDPIGWYALSSGDGGDTARLPRESGGSEIVTAAEDLLAAGCPALAGEIIRVLSAHADMRQLKSWWIEQFDRKAVDSWDQWVSVGAGLNVLGSLSSVEIASILDRGNRDVLDFGYIFKGGLNPKALTDENISDGLASFIQAGLKPDFKLWSTDSPLDTAALYLYGHSSSAFEYMRRRPGKTAIPRSMIPFQAFNSDIVRRGRIRAGAGQGVYDIVRSHFGDCWLTFRTGLEWFLRARSAASLSGDAPIGNVLTFDAGIIPICESAFTMKGDVAWWLDQASYANSVIHQQALISMMLAFAPEPILSACLSTVSAMVDLWKPFEIMAVFETLLAIDSCRPRLNVARVELSESNPAVQAFVGMRARMDQRLRVLDQAASGLTELRLRAFVAESIVRTCYSRMRQAGRWMGCRETAARYSSLAQSLGMIVTSGARYEPDSKDLDEQVVAEILADVSRYPSTIVRLADRCGIRQLARHTAPIAQTAQAEDWFDHPQPL